MAKVIEVFKKTDITLTFTYPSGTDLNGDTFYFTAKTKLGGAEDDSDAVITSEKTVSTSTNVVTIVLSDSDTDVSPRDYYADLKRVTSGGTITSSESFTLRVTQTVTQRSA